jgi:hypothetical protein
MPDLDLRAEFAKLCADAPAGDAGGAAYEETLGLAVQRLVRRTRGHRAGFSTRAVHEAGSPALDCPFMVSVATLSFESFAQGLL